MNLFLTAFITGLTTGGISCVALQGGLLSSMIANMKREEGANPAFTRSDWQPTALFLGSKIAVHTLFGFLLGALGSSVSIPLSLRLVFQLLTGLFLLITAANLLNVHPFFRHFAFQTPAFLARFIRRSKKNDQWFAPLLLGALTVFIPCGVTQAMEVIALGSGNPWLGAGVMFFFTLGTTPIFLALGVGTAQLADRWKGIFEKVAAALLVLLGLWYLNGVLLVLNSPLALQNLGRQVASLGQPPAWYGQRGGEALAPIENGVQKVTISVTNRGYSPKKITLQSGIPTELTLLSDGVYSCASFFSFPKFDIEMQLKPTDRQVVTFVPREKGTFSFSCSMGMYAGTVEVL